MIFILYNILYAMMMEGIKTKQWIFSELILIWNYDKLRHMLWSLQSSL